MNNLTMDADNQTYILSLDDVDIDLLPNYFKKKDKVMPIWSTSNLDSRQGSFYEFQVLAEKGDDDKDEEIKMIPCHICNIDTPLIYLKQHQNSTKHKICTQIADQALERAKKQMYEQFEYETRNSSSTYYCEPCALAIHIKDKQIHEKTKEHSNSMRYDTLLNELQMLYNENTKNLKLDRITTENKVDASTNTDIYDEELETTEMRDYIAEISSVHKTNYTITALDENYIHININGKGVKVSVNNFNGFFLMGEKVLCMLCATEVSDIKTHTSSRGHVEKVMAPLKNEHCIREIGSYKHCVICNKYVDSYHFNDAEHRLQLNKAITNDSEELNVPENYCEICDTILPIGQTSDSLAHTRGSDHRQFLWKSNPNLNHHLKKTEDPTIAECKICYLPVKNKDMHLESKVHMTRYKALLELNKIKKLDDIRIFCQVCCHRMLGIDELAHIRGKKHLKCIEEYNTGRISDTFFSQEQTNVKTDLLETEHEYLLNTDGVIHFVIDENNRETDEETAMIYNLLTEELDETDDSNLLNLKVTDGNLIMVLSNTDEALNDIKDVIKRKNNNVTKKPPADLTKVYYLMEKTDKLDILLCKVCQITVPNTVDDINEHNKSSGHNKSFFKCIDVAMSLVKKSKKTGNKGAEECDSGIQIDSKPSCSNSESKPPGLILQSSSHSEISMPSCSFSTPLPGSNSESNLFGSNSQLNQPSSSQLNLFGSNSQLNRPSSSQSNTSGSNSQLILPSRSESCLVPCSLPSSSKVALKTNGEGLTVKNGKEDFVFCDICLISVPNEETCLKRHYEASAHKYHAQNSLQINSVVGLATHSYHLLTKTQNPKELWCNACNVKVPYFPSNTSEHLQGANHEMNYNAMLEKNKLSKIDATTFFCGFCNINVVFSNIIDHITKGYHSLFVKSDIKFQHVVSSVQKPIMNANQIIPKTFHVCAICNVKVPNSDHDIKIHEKGRPHLENMKLQILELEKQAGSKLNYEMELKPTGVMHCKVCKVNVPSGNACVDTHLNGAPHKKAYKELLATHKIIKVGSKLHCQNCKVYFKVSTELNHIENMNHLVNTLANNGLVGGGNNSASSACQALPKPAKSRTRSRKNKNN